MNCKQARTLIPYAADAAADDSTLRLLREHIDACPSCRTFNELHEARIAAIKEALHTAAEEITLPVDFASRLTATIASQRLAPNAFDTLLGHIRQTLQDLLANRRAVASATCVVSLVAVIALGVLLGSVMDQSPTAVPRVTSGRLMTFTLQPTPDGRVLAGLNSRTYCQITRGREESLR